MTQVSSADCVADLSSRLEDWWRGNGFGFGFGFWIVIVPKDVVLEDPHEKGVEIAQCYCWRRRRHWLQLQSPQIVGTAK